MTNKIAKIIIKIIIIALIFQITTTPVASAKGFWSEIFQSGKEFIGDGKGEVRKNPTINEDEVNALNGKIYYGKSAKCDPYYIFRYEKYRLAYSTIM